MTDTDRSLMIGPEHPGAWWDEHSPEGDCRKCGGECDGDDCGLHSAGCIFGGFSYGYWLIADGCPRFHGEELVEADHAS
jgi:hypothetical protein